jgi:hypothetical protein
MNKQTKSLLQAPRITKSILSITFFCAVFCSCNSDTKNKSQTASNAQSDNAQAKVLSLSEDSLVSNIPAQALGFMYYKPKASLEASAVNIGNFYQKIGAEIQKMSKEDSENAKVVLKILQALEPEKFEEILFLAQGANEVDSKDKSKSTPEVGFVAKSDSEENAKKFLSNLEKSLQESGKVNLEKEENVLKVFIKKELVEAKDAKKVEDKSPIDLAKDYLVVSQAGEMVTIGYRKPFVYSTTTKENLFTSSNRFSEVRQRLSLAENFLSLAFLDFSKAEQLSQAYSAVANQPASTAPVDKLPLEYLAFTSSSVAKEDSFTIPSQKAVVGLKSDTPEVKKFLDVTGDNYAGSESLPVATDTALSLELDSSVLNSILERNGLLDNSPVMANFKPFLSTLKTLRIGFGKPQQGAMFPNVYLVSTSTNKDQTLDDFKSSITGLIAQNGFPLNWSESKLDGQSSFVAQTPIGLALNLQKQDDKFILATSSTILSSLAKGGEESATTSSAGLFSLFVSGKQLKQFVEGVQGPLALLTGGAQANNFDLKSLDELGSLKFLLTLQEKDLVLDIFSKA